MSIDLQSSPVHSPPPDGRPAFGRKDTLVYLIMVIAALTMLFTARLLQPAPGSVGTHEQLGLPPCPFFHFTGLPCPTCGFTTCFAHASRGHIYRALVVQPFGLLVFGLTLASLPISLLLFIRRKAWSEAIDARRARIIGYTLLILFVLGWIYKIIAMSGLHLHG